MIEKMHKITVLCLNKYRQKAVEALQKLGTIHVVESRPPESEEITVLRQTATKLQQLENFLQDLKLPDDTMATQKPSVAALPPEKQLKNALSLMDEAKELEERNNLLYLAHDGLKPWGHFQPALLDKLQDAGWYYALCCGQIKELPELPADCNRFLITQVNGIQYFLLLSQTDLAQFDNLPRANFPLGMDLRKLEDELYNVQTRLFKLYEQLLGFRSSQQKYLKQSMLDLENKLSFAAARDSMGTVDMLCYLNGFVPSLQLEQLRQTAKDNGWGLLYEEAKLDDEEVPTKLRIPRHFQVAQTIFDAIGVMPGYNETDVSVAFVIFLTIFCSFLVGDAGYGCLFALIDVILRCKFGKSPKSKQLLNLFAAFSIGIFIFGAASGNWFGLPVEKLPKWMRGLPWLSADETGDNLKNLCFFVGATHLSIARIWSAIRDGKKCSALGHIGWAFFLWGNFFTVKFLISGGEFNPIAKVFYAIAVPLILLFSINWKDFGDVIYSPFNFINSVVDVLSYIRLYAVGLSSIYIAMNFNEMNKMIWEANAGFIPICIIFLLLGHTLNIVLAMMGILVHGIRLNTLEFSNHIGLSWSGKPYNPLH